MLSREADTKSAVDKFVIYYKRARQRPYKKGGTRADRSRSRRCRRIVRRCLDSTASMTRAIPGLQLAVLTAARAVTAARSTCRWLVSVFVAVRKVLDAESSSATQPQRTQNGSRRTYQIRPARSPHQCLVQIRATNVDPALHGGAYKRRQMDARATRICASAASPS